MSVGGREVTMRRGLSSRASQGERNEGVARGFEAARVREPRDPEERTGRTAQTAPQRQTLLRAKRLSAVSGIAVAVALASVGYGAWSSAASHAAVAEATAGAEPTLVAARDIRAGDRLSTESFTVKEVPRAWRSEAVLGSEALADGSATGRALVDIPAGSPMAASFVTGAGGGDRLSAEIESGMEAVTIAVDTETGLAGQVRPYDAVRVVSVEGASADTSLLTTLCDRARVVAVGDGASGGDIAYSSVTLEVSPAQADAVREAQYAGRVSLVLLAAEDALNDAREISAPVGEGLTEYEEGDRG